MEYTVASNFCGCQPQPTQITAIHIYACKNWICLLRDFIVVHFHLLNVFLHYKIVLLTCKLLVGGAIFRSKKIRNNAMELLVSLYVFMHILYIHMLSMYFI